MSTTVERIGHLPIEPDPTAIAVETTDDMLHVTLSDGRELLVPLAWFPRLRDASPAERLGWEPIGRGHGIHFPELDEDISVRALLGRPT